MDQNVTHTPRSSVVQHCSLGFLSQQGNCSATGQQGIVLLGELSEISYNTSNSLGVAEYAQNPGVWKVKIKILGAITYRNLLSAKHHPKHNYIYM